MGKFDTTHGCPSDATSICNKHRLNNFLYLNHLRATELGRAVFGYHDSAHDSSSKGKVPGQQLEQAE